MTTGDQLFLGFDVSIIPRGDGEVIVRRSSRLEIKGSVKQAGKVLGCGKQTVLDLIADGAIIAWKLREGPRKNNKFVVDMTSVYALLEQRRAAATRKRD